MNFQSKDFQSKDFQSKDFQSKDFQAMRSIDRSLQPVGRATLGQARAQLGSALMVLVTAYFCLGTSCDDGATFVDAETLAVFEPGQTEVALLVKATGTYLWVSVSDGFEIQGPSREQPLGAAGSGSDTCGVLLPREPEWATEGLCYELGSEESSEEGAEETLIYTLTRVDASSPLKARVWATVEEEGDCDSSASEPVGVSLSILEPE